METTSIYNCKTLATIGPKPTPECDLEFDDPNG